MLHKLDDIMRTIQDAVVNDERFSTEEIARQIEKKHKTLLREVNPHDDKAKLSCIDLVRILEYTDNLAPLQHMANHLGYALVKIPDDVRGCKQLDDAMCCAAYEYSRTVLAYTGERKKQEFTPDGYRNFDRRIHDLIAALYAWREHYFQHLAR